MISKKDKNYSLKHVPEMIYVAIGGDQFSNRRRAILYRKHYIYTYVVSHLIEQKQKAKDCH